MIKIFPAQLEETFMLTKNVKHFILRIDPTVGFNYIPGQFITVHFPCGEKTLKRSYSIANIPSENNCIEFAAGFVEGGPGSQYLFNLAPQDILQISGPYGRLILKESLPKRYILAATSTGITPYRAMLKQLAILLKAHPQLKVVVLFGVPYHEDRLYSEDFNQLVKNYPEQVSFRIQLSRAAPEVLQAGEYQGYVQHAFEALQLDPQGDMVYLCGNPGMIDASFDYLKEKGFGMQQIIREKYISGAGAS